jgi:hypothetical protein
MRSFLLAREAELQKKKVIHTPLYPAFSEAEIEHWYQKMELGQKKYERLSEEMEGNEELKKKRPFTPTDELKFLVRRVNEAEMEYELNYDKYKFFIEANLAVFHRRKTISEVREEWSKSLFGIRQRVANSKELNKNMQEWEEMLKTPEEKEERPMRDIAGAHQPNITS